MNNTIKWILFSIVLIIMIVWMTQFGGLLEQKTWKDQCKSSVLINSVQQELFPAKMTKPVNCPIQNYNLSGSKLNMERELSDVMVDCWDIYGEGKLNLFNSSEGIFCAPCATVSFKDKVGNLDLFDYMSSNKLKNEKITYFEYLSGYDPKLDNTLLNSGIKFNIDTSKNYSVIFQYIKGESSFKQYLNNLEDNYKLSGAFAFGGAIGTVIGGGTFVTGGTILIASGIIYSGYILINKLSKYISLLTGNNNIESVSFVVVKENNADDLSTLSCQYIPINFRSNSRGVIIE